MTGEGTWAAKVPRGSLLARIEYALFPWEEPPKASAPVDFVLMGVRLTFANGEITRFGWRLDEGLGSLTLADDDEPLPVSSRWEDVSSRWAELIGRGVTDVLVAVQVESVSRPTPWAARLSFDGDRSLVVALGEVLDGGVVSYIPDSLVVTASETVARAYRPVAAEASAWAEHRI